MKKFFLLLIILFVSSCGSLPEENAGIEPQEQIIIQEPLLIQSITGNYKPLPDQE